MVEVHVVFGSPVVFRVSRLVGPVLVPLVRLQILAVVDRGGGTVEYRVVS